MRRLLFAVGILVSGAVAALAFAAPAIEAGGGGHGGCMSPPRDGTGDAVEIRNACYTPAILYAEPGTTVTWTNRDLDFHNVTLLDGKPLGGTDQLAQGGAYGLTQDRSFSYTFESAGHFPYYCSIHPSMIGVVAVGDPASLDLRADALEQAGVVTPGAPNARDDRGLDGLPWREATVGLGLFSGLLVGLVAAGGIKFSRG